MVQVKTKAQFEADVRAAGLEDLAAKAAHAAALRGPGELVAGKRPGAVRGRRALCLLLRARDGRERWSNAELAALFGVTRTAIRYLLLEGADH